MKEKAIVWGTGKRGGEVEAFVGQNYEIIFYIDSNPKKFGKIFNKRKIYSPDVLVNYQETTIIIAVDEDLNIRKNLLCYGCKKVYKFSFHSLRPMDNDLYLNYRKMNVTSWNESHTLLSFSRPYSCTSQLCNASFFDMPFFHYWGSKLMPPLVEQMKKLCQGNKDSYQQSILYHRKLWEWVYICQALYENGFLCAGKSGIGFGVGAEVLPDLFASFGCKVLATDLSSENARASGWIQSGQNLDGDIDNLHRYQFTRKEDFQRRVAFMNIDMNNIPTTLEGFDFAWSSCALEHLGSLKNGMIFIKNSLNTLKNSGIAVHTTEYNLFSNDKTIESDNLSIYRKCDIENLITEIRDEGHYVYPLDLHLEERCIDKFIDLPPYAQKNVHLKMSIGEFPCTSIGLIIRKKAIHSK